MSAPKSTSPGLIVMDGFEPPADGLLAGHLTRILQARRIPLTNEKEVQAHISTILSELGIFHAREFRLAPSDIADFWIQNNNGKGMVLEVKMNRAKAREALAQLARYAEHDMVSSLVLITNKAMALPAAMGGKALFTISLGRAWL